MIRKQLYIEERQEQALKARARELGVTEAEIVRDALDRALSEPASAARSSAAIAARMKRLEELLENADDLAARASPEPGARFDRESVYSGERRFDRWKQD